LIENRVVGDGLRFVGAERVLGFQEQ